jgi:hypothetical protein
MDKSQKEHEVVKVRIWAAHVRCSQNSLPLEQLELLLHSQKKNMISLIYEMKS